MSVTSFDISEHCLDGYTCANATQPLLWGFGGAAPPLLQSPWLRPLAAELVGEMRQHVEWLLWAEILLPSLLSEWISLCFKRHL